MGYFDELFAYSDSIEIIQSIRDPSCKYNINGRRREERNSNNNNDNDVFCPGGDLLPAFGAVAVKI